jgi:hypothetical protein
MKYGPVGEAEFTNRKLLLTAAAVATASWFVFAVWRGTQSTPRGVAPELYDSLKTEYLALRAAVFPKADVQVAPPAADAKAILPAVSDGPLPQDAIPGYLYALGKEIRFEEAVLPDGMTPSPRSWNIGSAYLQAQRKLAYVRDSLIAHESEKGVLQAHAFNLELRLTGSNLPEATRIQLSDQLKAAKTRIDTGTNPGAHARSLYMIAAALSSYVYSRQKALLQMQSQQHWLVVVVQVIAAVILSIAVLAGSTAEAIAAGVLFFMVAAGSGILSLLHVRQSVQSAEYGDDYGLFRIELARAFTLSGMAGLIAVFLIANLPILAGAGVFDPPPVTEAPGTPAATEVLTAPGGSPEATEAMSTGAPSSATEEATELVSSGTPAGIAQAIPPGPKIRAFSSSFTLPPEFLAQDTTDTDPDSSANDGTDGEDTTDADTGSSATDGTIEDDTPEWVPLRDIFAFSNLGGILVALLAGWVPERIFRTLTVKGEQLRLDIQSVSRSGT